MQVISLLTMTRVFIMSNPVEYILKMLYLTHKIKCKSFLLSKYADFKLTQRLVYANLFYVIIEI